MRPMPADTNSTTEPRQLVLMKKNQRWVFRYMPGEENVVLHWLAQTARDEQTDFDWFDAAVLSHQMGDQMGAQLKAMMHT